MLLERWKMGRWNNIRSRQLHRSHMPPAPVWVIAALKSNTHSFQRPYTPVSTPSWGCWEISLTHSIWRLLVIAVHSHIHSHLVHCLGIWNQHKIIMSRAGLSTLVSQAGELKALPRLSSVTPAFRSLCPASRPVSEPPGGKPCPSKKGHSGSQRALSQTGGPKMLLIM